MSVAVSTRQEVAAAPGGGQLGRDDAPRRDERIQRRFAAAGQQPQLVGERRRGRPPRCRWSRPTCAGASGWRRAAGSLRDRGVTASWSASAVVSAGLGDTALDGAGEPARRRGRPRGRVWWSPSFEIHSSVAGASSTAGVTAMRAHVVPAGGVAGRAGTGPCSRRSSSRSRRSGRSACRRRRRRPRAGVGPPTIGEYFGAGRSSSSRACPPSSRRPCPTWNRSSTPVLEHEQVAVDEQRRSCRRSAARWRARGSRRPGTRRRRPPASRPGSAARTGRPRTACTARGSASCR